MSEGYKLSARYGASFYDEEALWVQIYGTEQDKKRLSERRHEEFTRRVVSAIQTKLHRLEGMNGVNPTANRVNVYQEWTRKHWHDNEEDSQILHACMGLAGETGEVVDLVKKSIFTPHRLEGQDYRVEVTKELGDVMYYLCRLADELNIDMYDVLQTNIDKLDERYGK